MKWSGWVAAAISLIIAILTFGTYWGATGEAIDELRRWQERHMRYFHQPSGGS